MLEEDAVMNYCLERGLVQLGWIHVRDRRGEAAWFGAARGVSWRPEAYATALRPHFPGPRAVLQTHPSQTCFMSSMDLHTQGSVQAMLPEAIAIVVAPTDPAVPYQVYQLTDAASGGGLELIQSCTLRGFHQHTGSDRIYDVCRHVVWHDGPVTIADLRHG